jgi:hypothetical protein
LSKTPGAKNKSQNEIVVKDFTGNEITVHDDKYAQKYARHKAFYALMVLPRVDFENPEAVKARISDYMQVCAENGLDPTVSSAALALGVNRNILPQIRDRVSPYAWVKALPSETSDIIKGLYALLDAEIEADLQDSGKPVIGSIFRAKVNHEWREPNEVTVIHKNAFGDYANTGDLMEKYKEAEIVEEDCGEEN